MFVNEYFKMVIYLGVSLRQCCIALPTLAIQDEVKILHKFQPSTQKFQTDVARELLRSGHLIQIYHWREKTCLRSGES